VSVLMQSRDLSSTKITSHLHTMIDSQNLRIINPVRNFGSGALYDNTTFDSCLIFC